MKLCAIVCEYNPFHNGHKYLIEQAKELSGCDGALCLMSASFTQRGDIAVMDKFSRAVHAIKGGADCVIQLPVSFSVAPAEIFARGAIKLISSVPDVCAIAFGCENADADKLNKNADILANENEKYKTFLKQRLENGESYAKSCQNALSLCGGDGNLLNGSNNILALEYVKAIKKINSNIKIIPVERVGAHFNDGKLQKSFSSATAIRQNIASKKIKKCVPDYVYEDIKNNPEIKDFNNSFGKLMQYSLVNRSAESMKGIFGCAEGLENKLKNEAAKCKNAEEIIAAATNKRYTSSRIRRIMCANALGLYENDCKTYLSSPLYLKPLAVKENTADDMLAALSRSDYPIVIRKNDTRNLCDTALNCFEKDEFADETRAIICGERFYNYTIKIV